MAGFLSEEHDALRDSVRKFVDKEVMPIVDDLDTKGAEIPMDVIRKMAENGYFGLILPEQYGGAGMDHLSMAIVTEELSRGWLSVGSVMTRNVIAGTLILNGGTEEQKKRWLPGLATGELLSAAAFTEPNHGSDTASFELKAEKRGDVYVLNGPKTWCTFANRANIMTILARTNPDKSQRHKGLSMLVLEKKPGDEFMPPKLTGSYIPAIGYHGLKSWSLNFEDLEIPASNVVGGEEGKGFYQLMTTYESARIQTAARGLGVAQAAYDHALQYARERKQFGKYLAEHQLIRHKLAHMATEVEALRQLLYYACVMKDQGKRCDLEAGMAKIKAGEVAEHVTSDALQIHGGYGYSKEYRAQRFWRDGRIIKIFEGTSEIQAEVVAKRIIDGK